MNMSQKSKVTIQNNKQLKSKGESKLNNTIVIPVNYDDKNYSVDLVSERFLKRRIIYITGEINDAMAQKVIAQLQYLEERAPDLDIYLYINSPGGSISAGMAIYDTMNYIKCNVSTICIGMAASMGAFLLAAGTKGKRYVLPNSETMIHQPLGGVQGQASDITLVAEHIAKIKKRLNLILAKNTNQPLDKIETDSDRDYWMDARETVSYGLADEIGTPDFDHDIWR